MTTTSIPETGPEATGPVTFVHGHGPGRRPR